MVDVLINCDFLVIKTRYATIVTVGRDDNNGYQHSDEWNGEEEDEAAEEAAGFDGDEHEVRE